MKALILRTPQIVIGLLAFTLVVNLLVLQIPYFDGAKFILGAAWLVLLPGWLITRLIRLRTAGIWELIAYMTGFGLLSVMLAALITNTLLTLFGDPQPLTTVGLLTGFDIAWLALIGLYAWRNPKDQFKFAPARPDWLAVSFALAGLPVVGLAILGAVTLNNGGPNYLTVAMLSYTAAYLGVMVGLRKRLPQAALLAGLYQVALGVLLMTSLRGWYTTGHDVQREYRVFLMALANLHWDVSALRDAYNACLSITLLPATVRQVLGIPEVWVYKTFFQAAFALVPVIIYLIAHRHTGRLAALLGAVYFLAFPTYFGDMPMLNRQEIAFVFVALIFLTLFSTGWSILRRRWLIAVLGVGVVLSHYSTTYTMIALFLMVVSLRFGLRWLAGHVGSAKLRRRLGLDRWRLRHRTPVGLPLIVVLICVSYVWSTQLTNTGGNITRVLGETIQGIQRGIGSDSKSSDTNYSLFGAPKLSDQQRLQAYIDKTVPAKRAQTPPKDLYPASAYQQYPATIVPPNSQDLTPAGQALQHLGIPVAGLNTVLHQASAVFLQIMLIVGIIWLMLSRTHKTEIDNEYRLFQLAGLAFVAAIILLPVLSAEYGLLRAFQQILLLGGAAIALATLKIWPRRLAKYATVLATTLAIGFFVSSTGLVTALFGGYPAQMHLANQGKYYDLYYAHESEQKAISWLSVITDNPHSPSEVSSSIETDRYTLGRLSQFSDLDIHDSIYPGTLTRYAYVFVGNATLDRGTATVYYNGDPLTYRYPIQFLDDNKDLIYANNGARIYR